MFTQDILNFAEAAAKVLHMDSSHDAVRHKLQQQVMADHRASNPDDSSYYNYPYVADVYGDGTTGQVVMASRGKHTMAKYQASGDGYKLSGHTPVKRAYVVDKTDSKESIVYLDGEEMATLAAKEAWEDECESEIVNLREAALDANGNGMLKLIAPGHGSTGYYSKEVLKEAAKNKVFHKGLQMFFDHQTEAEEADRPEGSVKNLAATLTGDAEYHENGIEGPGLYAPIAAVKDNADFINNRASIMGASIRALGKGKMGQVGGRVTRIVEELVKAKSVDFVTRAGAGGKLVPLLESFRQEKAGQKERQPAAKEEKIMAEINDKDLQALKESAALVPTMKLQLERQTDRLARIDARDEATTYLRESGLPAPAQRRLVNLVTSVQYELPTSDGVLDVTKFREALKALVADEASYLKEAGVTKPVVAGLGESKEAAKESKEETSEEATQKEAERLAAELDKGIHSLTGVERKA